MDCPILPSSGTTSASQTISTPSEESASSSLDPDIPRSSMKNYDDISSESSDMAFDDGDHPEDGNERDHEDDPNNEDDVEASFLQCNKLPCSKRTLVSCLSGRSTSPGPLSPFLSEDDFAATPTSSACLSRRSSDSEVPRVRFKRGCVITAVNLTWAPTSYDRAPIDVAQSLDIKRCHSIDRTGENMDVNAAADTTNWDQDIERQVPAPPSPPLASSPCTAAHTAYAYANTLGELSNHQWDHCPVPGLVMDDSSSSDSDEYNWLNRCSLDTSFGAAAREIACQDAIMQHDSTVSSGSRSPPFSLEKVDQQHQDGGAALKARRDEPEEMPIKKIARRTIGKYNRDDLYASCEALGGF